jgi:hypothetical protein
LIYSNPLKMQKKGQMEPGTTVGELRVACGPGAVEYFGGYQTAEML